MASCRGTRRPSLVSRKPITGRFLVALVVVVAHPSLAETWTLETAQRRVLERADLDGLADAAAARERAAGAAALPRDNPFLGYQREQSFGAADTGTAEDYLWLGHTFDLSLRRGLYEEAGERRAEAARYLVVDRRRELAAGVASLYASALSQQRAAGSQRRWLSRLRELASTTRAREQAGDASRYDVLRVEREVAVAEQRLHEAEVELSRLEGELSTWLADAPGTMTLTGDLAPGPAPTSGEVPRAPSALALDEEARALALEQDAAGRWFLPPVTVTAGGKTVLAPGVVEAGYLLTAQVPLPLFERNQALAAELAAARRVNAAEAELRARDVERAAAGAVAAWGRAMDALAAHEQRVAGRSSELIETARAAFSGGELSLLALLEAERAALDDERTTADLALRARLAQVRHSALTSEVSP